MIYFAYFGLSVCLVVIIVTILGLTQIISKTESSANLKLTKEYI